MLESRRLQSDFSVLTYSSNKLKIIKKGKNIG